MALFAARNRLIARFIAVYGTFCKGVVLGDEPPEPLVEHMGVDLRGGNIGMSEQFLHRAQVGTVGEKMARESVPENVRRNQPDGNPGAPGERFEVAGEDLTREMATVRRRGKQPFGIVVAIETRGITGLDPLRQRGLGGPGKRHHALLVALAARHQKPAAIGKHTLGQADELAHPHAGGVEQFKERAEADLLPFLEIRLGGNDIGFRLFEKPGDVLDAEDFRERAGVRTIYPPPKNIYPCSRGERAKVLCATDTHLSLYLSELLYYVLLLF